MPVLRAPQPVRWLSETAHRRTRRQHLSIVEHHRPRTDRRPTDDRFTLVVITYNRRDEVVANLRRLQDLPEQPRIVIVDNASTDGTTATIRARHPDLEVLKLDRNAGAIGRNLAVERATTDYVAFADDDTWWEPGSLSAAADTLDRWTQVAVVTARILIEPGGSEDPVVDDMRFSPLPDEPGLPGHPLLSFLAGASMVRRSAFRQVGGFEPRLWIGGEEELMAADLAAAGWAMRYVPWLTVHHAASTARDPHRRRENGLRNTFWTTWLRRPCSRALWRTGAILRRAPRDVITLKAVGAALRGVPWVLRERRRLPVEVEHGLALLDRQQMTSEARRYVS